MDSNELYISLPTYNEAHVLAQVLSKLNDLGYDNILVIDDGSTDHSESIARKNRATVVKHLYNRGAGAASQTAISFAKRNSIQYLLLMDADDQHDPRDIKLLHDEILKDNYDIIIGNRFDSALNKIPRSRLLFNSIGNRLTNLFCANNYSDTQSGFRILNRRAIEKLNLKVDGYGFCSEMIIVGEKLGLRIGELPISVKYTEYSMGKGQSFSKGLSTAFNFMWRIIFN